MPDTKSRVKALRKIFDKNTFELREEFVILMFGNNDSPIGCESISKGDKGSVSPDLHYLFQLLYSSGASRFIIAHNHPSEDPLPSDPDLEITQTILIQANFLGFDFMDHVILSSDKSYSFVDNGLLV